MLASFCKTNFPNSFKSLLIFCSLSKNSGKTDKILAANEISFKSISTSIFDKKDFNIGNKEYVAKRGASSVLVYIIFDFINNKFLISKNIF